MSHHFLSEVKRLENQPHHSPHVSSEAAGDRPVHAEMPLDESPIIDVEYTSSSEPASTEAETSTQSTSIDLTLTPEPSETPESSEETSNEDALNEDALNEDALDEDALGEDALIPDNSGEALEPESSDTHSVTNSITNIDGYVTSHATSDDVQDIDSGHAESPAGESDGSGSEAVVVTVVSETIPHDDISRHNEDVEKETILTQANEELAAALQREEGLKARVQDLERQLSEEQRQVEKLRLDLEIVTTSKKELLADLAEAKRYILNLTGGQSPPPSPPAQTVSVKQSSPSPERRTGSVNQGVGRYEPRSGKPTPQPLSPTPQSRHPYPSQPQPSRTPSPRTPSPRTPQPTSSASTHAQGLPPMSTEQLQGLPPMSSERLASAPSTPAKSGSLPKALSRPAPSRSPHPSSRQPLILPERKPGKPTKSVSGQSSDQSPKPPKDEQPTNGSNGKGSGLSTMRRSPLRPMSRGDRPIPEVARDTHKTVPEPKLSNSEISWFD